MTTMTSTAPMAVVRKKIATTGKTIGQQIQMAAQLQAQGNDVHKTIRRMKKTCKHQKETTKTNYVKFEWLQEHSCCKKLEKNLSKELESLLLRMYNQASKAHASKKWLQPTQSDTQPITEDESHNDPTQASVVCGSPSRAYAAELEYLIQTEQLNRVALINQVSSEREQRAALKQILLAISHEENTGAHLNSNSQLLTKESQANVRQLIYDAIIGRQMIEITLEAEVQKCKKELNITYQKVAKTLREVTSSAVNLLSDQQHTISVLVEAAGGNECSDEILRRKIYEEFGMLFAQLRNDLAQYEKEFTSAASACDAATSSEAASSRHGGWSDIDAERFSSVFYSYDKNYGAGKNLHLLYDQVALVLPNIPLDEIKKHTKFYQHFRFYHEKRKNRQREFQRKLKEKQSQATTKFRQAVEREEEKNRKFKQLKEMQQQCELHRDRLSQWRDIREAKERIDRQQLEIEQMLKHQRQQQENLRWCRKQNQQKLEINDYRKDKRMQQMADEKFAIEEDQQRYEERAFQSVINAQRVQYRHYALQRKLDDMKQEGIHKVQLEEQRLAKLNALKEETPYAQIIANIAPDPERTRKETAAFRANVEAAQKGLSIMETGLFPSNGYDCETLFKNARFKLGIALRVAL